MNRHKDKERLRHQKQVKLLDDVMRIVPRPLNDSVSKVRKLRHLALYYHFMQKVHAQITEGHSNIIKDSKKSSKKTPLKLARKPLKVLCASKKKPPRANIVFLQVDRSKSEEQNIFDEPATKENDNFSESSCVKKLEYKVPEIVVVNENDDSNAAFDHNLGLPIGNMPVHSNYSSSSSEFSLQLDLASEDNYNAEKENHSPTKTNFLINNLNDQISKQLGERISENINNENSIHSKCKKNDFQNILQDYSSNSTLRDLTVPNITTENICVTDINSPEQDSSYLLEIHPFENISGYPINLSSRDVILTSNNLNYKPLYALNSSLLHSQLQSLPSLPENLSDNYSSSTLTDLHIDVENFSDSSNEVGKMNAGNSSDINTNNNAFDSPKALAYEFPHGTLMNYDDYIMPFVSSGYNCLENYNEQNEISSRSMSYLPHFDTISPNIAGFNESSTVIQCFEPVHSFQNRLVEPRFISENVTLYSPTFIENFSSERSSSLLNPRLEIKSEPDSQEVFSEENTPNRLFEEEVSYPLSQYINNY